MNPQPVQAEVRPAGEEDLAAISALAGVIWRQHYPGIISHAQIDYMLGKMYALDMLREDVHLRKIRFYQLIVEGRMAGFGAIGPLEAPGVWKLYKLYMLPEFHGRGLGSRLLQHCEAEARRFGARCLRLEVNKRNHRPLAAYQRNGFTVVESVVTDFGGGFFMDDYVMAKDLDGDRPA